MKYIIILFILFLCGCDPAGEGKYGDYGINHLHVKCLSGVKYYVTFSDGSGSKFAPVYNAKTKEVDVCE